MQITSGRIPGAQKALIYGPEGIGKSTLAALFPDPLFIDVEGSTKHMDVNRLPFPSSWTMLMEQLAFVATHPDCCKTLVIDTADWAEGLCISHICAKAQVGGIEDFGYGKGYTYLAEEFGNLLNRLTEVVDRGIHVVLTAHSQIRKFEQPDESAAYDRWELKLQKKTAPLVREWCDMVLFVNYKTFVVKSEATKTAKGAGGRERVAYTTHTATWDAKNRHDLPDDFPVGDGTALPPVLAAAIAFEGSTPQAPAPSVEQQLTKEFGEPQVIPHPVPEPVQESLTPIADAIEEEFAQEGGAAPYPAQAPEARLKPLYDLMALGNATEADVRKVVADKGYFPEQTEITVYPQDFVDGVLVAAWPKVLARINELKELDQVPFK